jgi:hypothetical protein
MDMVPKKCEDINAVKPFCECIGGGEPVDPAAEAFCERVERGSSGATGDELLELKKALKDMEETDPDECCCDC